MIDNFALGLTHGLLLLAAWLLLSRPDLDREGPAPGRRSKRPPVPPVPPAASPGAAPPSVSPSAADA